MFSSRTQTYALLSNGEQKSENVDFDAESERASTETESTASPISLRQAVVRNLLTTILAFYSVGISVVLFATFVNFVEKENRCNIGPYPAWKEFAHPDLDSIPIDYDQHVIFNGTLDFPSIYRGSPRPELDAAWNRATDLGPLDIQLSADEIERLGVDAATAVRLPPENGGGFFVNLEFQHQLHCVNYLRMMTYMSYYEKTSIEFTDSKRTQRMHLDHCIEMLRQVIMCNTDINLIPTQWVHGRDRPYPNFNTKHVCRNYEAILQWSIEHQVQPGLMTKPPGAKELPVPP
ncbi:hypothetical protein ZTR_04224 [Talaromyces verruculosus]|nr:hypothetical protein ZTR_04224 [Talaromyces verruculosus]